MNKIVREHYPVEKLPDDLRAGINAHTRVTVTIVPEGDGIPYLLLEAMDAPDRPKRSKDEIDQFTSLIRSD